MAGASLGNSNGQDTDPVYVAVGKEVKECKLLLTWALQNLAGRKMYLLHVHQPAQLIPLPMGGKFPVSEVGERELTAFRNIEMEKMSKVLKEYLSLCLRVGIRAEEVHTDWDSIEKGIVDLISQHGIKRLVMGAAADKLYSKRNMDIRSKKAQYVRLKAPASCHIWFICKGHLIYTREAIIDRVLPAMTPTLTEVIQVSENIQQSHLRSQSHIPVSNNGLRLNSPFQDSNTRHSLQMRRLRFSELGSPSTNEQVFSPNSSRLDAEATSDERYGSSMYTPARSSHHSRCSSNDAFVATVIPLTYAEGEGSYSQLLPCAPQEVSASEEIYDKLVEAQAEVESSTRIAFEESSKRRKAEKEAVEATRRAKMAESLYNKGLNERKIVEERLQQAIQEHENTKNQNDKVREELKDALDQNCFLESQLIDNKEMLEELEDKLESAMELSEQFQKEINEMKRDRDQTLKEVENLRAKQSGTSSTGAEWLSNFSYWEIEVATDNFHISLKIGEGGYGSIYKGLLRHAEVAVKMLNPQSSQGPEEYQHEIDALSRLRHPNIITLIGTCPEACTLIYEYLPNGNLEDRLISKDNSLSWKIRMRIAAEICSALIFLHSSKPFGMIHGNLKPSNILLDANFASKLSDFGSCRKLCNEEKSSNGFTLCHRTVPQGTFAYMDPEFLSTGELTAMSDVYSFGIILLRLLTGRPALGITKDVKSALLNGSLKDLLDSSAGDWPYQQAEQLARSALRCSEMNREDRPNLHSDVWRVLEPIRTSSGGSLSMSRWRSEEQAPHYFICPIFQEVMRDPHVAADGFTYEAEALKGWLDSGHDSSPMTNLKLSHTELVPNRVLRSAIQEWLQQH